MKVFQSFQYVLKTTKFFEAQSGIDWEWWIGDDRSGWLRFAIQAKKIGPNGRYDALKHHVNLPHGRKMYQHNLLKRYAKAHGAIPLYCLFNSSINFDKNRHWHCSSHEEPEQLGCTLVPVKRIEEAIRKRGCRTFDYIHRDPNTFPWRCLFCPKCAGLSALLISSRFSTGRLPRRYFDLPPILARAKATDGILRPEDEADLPLEESSQRVNENAQSNLLIRPRRIMLIETNLSEISEEIGILTSWD